MLRRGYQFLLGALGSRLVFRRAILVSGLVGAWPVVDRLTQVEVLTKATPGGATIAVAVVGLLGVIVKLYIDLRDRDDKQ